MQEDAAVKFDAALRDAITKRGSPA